MKIQSPLVNKIGGLAITTFVRSWMRTLDYQAAFYDETVDPAHPGFRGPKIFIFWHEYIPIPFYLRGHCKITMLLSRHQDAEFLSEAARHMGFSTVRGSSNRGGVGALRQLIRTGKLENLAITPDGPRGPRRRLAQGPIYLASRLQMPLVMFGFGYNRPWRMRTWDRFAVPKPFSRVRAIASPAIDIPADLDRDGLEFYRQRMETLMNRLTKESEDWADSNERWVEQKAAWRKPMPISQRRAA